MFKRIGFLVFVAFASGCDSGYGEAHIPEPVPNTVSKQNAEMATFIQMAGGQCIKATSVYEQTSFLGNSNKFGVKCAEYGTQSEVTYVVDKNLNTISK